MRIADMLAAKCQSRKQNPTPTIAFLGDSIEVRAQVVGEIERHLLCTCRILLAEVVNACHDVVDEVRPHLQRHDLCLLSGGFFALVNIDAQLVA